MVLNDFKILDLKKIDKIFNVKIKLGKKGLEKN